MSLNLYFFSSTKSLRNKKLSNIKYYENQRVSLSFFGTGNLYDFNITLNVGVLYFNMTDLTLSKDFLRYDKKSLQPN